MIHETQDEGHTHFRAATSAASITHSSTLTHLPLVLPLMGSVISTPEISLFLYFMAPLGTDALLELVARGEAGVLEKADRWDGVRKVRHAPK